MPYTFVLMSKATDGVHKHVVELLNTDTKRTKTIKFGAAGAKDFIQYQKEGKAVAEARKAAYIARHNKREDWTKSGVDTAGFWSRWILWNMPTLGASLADAKKRM